MRAMYRSNLAPSGAQHDIIPDCRYNVVSNRSIRGAGAGWGCMAAPSPNRLPCSHRLTEIITTCFIYISQRLFSSIRPKKGNQPKENDAFLPH